MYRAPPESFHPVAGPTTYEIDRPAAQLAIIPTSRGVHYAERPYSFTAVYT